MLDTDDAVVLHGKCLSKYACPHQLTGLPKRKVHDLPQLHAQPSASSLLDALRTLEVEPLSLSAARQTPSSKQTPSKTHVDPVGIPRYLTSIISSTLPWIECEESRERIWAAAGAQLSQRCGRTAMPDMVRTFEVPVSASETASIRLHEPSLTSDNLGLKTWTSSVLLARRLASLPPQWSAVRVRVLELGAGTGLLGIAAACAWGPDVTLTDLAEILPNLQRNVDTNRELIEGFGGTARVLPLDWSESEHGPVHDDDRFTIILVADPIYSPEHPHLLVETVDRWLLRKPTARLILELPLRPGYEQERAMLKSKLGGIGLEISQEGFECGTEDWQTESGHQVEVECWWAVWRVRSSTRN